LRWTTLRPPKEAARRATEMATASLVTQGSRAMVGASWETRERGIWEYHLSGEPLSIGYSHARLGAHLLMETEDYMFTGMHRYVPSQVALFLIRLGVLYRYRHLLRNVTADLQTELTGLAAGQLDLHGDFLPMFHRVVFYHALHDITQTLEHSPLLGCTAFA